MNDPCLQQQQMSNAKNHSRRYSNVDKKEEDKLLTSFDNMYESSGNQNNQTIMNDTCINLIENQKDATEPNNFLFQQS